MNTFDENDQRNHPRPDDTDFSRMVNTLLSRRQLLGAAGAGMGLFLGGQGLAQAANVGKNVGPRIGFAPVDVRDIAIAQLQLRDAHQVAAVRLDRGGELGGVHR